MLPRCRTVGEPFVIPTFDVQVSDVEGFMDELQEFQSVFHDCFARSEARAHCLDYMVGQYSPLPRKSIEPMARAVEGSRVRSLQRFLAFCRDLSHVGLAVEAIANHDPADPEFFRLVPPKSHAGMDLVPRFDRSRSPHAGLITFVLGWLR